MPFFMPTWVSYHCSKVLMLAFLLHKSKWKNRFCIFKYLFQLYSTSSLYSKIWTSFLGFPWQNKRIWWWNKIRNTFSHNCGGCNSKANVLVAFTNFSASPLWPVGVCLISPHPMRSCLYVAVLYPPDSSVCCNLILLQRHLSFILE